MLRLFAKKSTRFISLEFRVSGNSKQYRLFSTASPFEDATTSDYIYSDNKRQIEELDDIFPEKLFLDLREDKSRVIPEDQSSNRTSYTPYSFFVKGKLKDLTDHQYLLDIFTYSDFVRLNELGFKTEGQ